MRGTLHAHGFILLFVELECSLVVVDEINVVSVAFLKAKDDAPICPDSHTPEPSELPFQAVQSKTRQVHVLRPAGAIQNGQDVFYFFELIRAEAFALPSRLSFENRLIEPQPHRSAI